MESINKLLFIIFIILSICNVARGNAQINAPLKEEKKEVVGVFYLNKTYGHIHQNPTAYSSILTNLSCGHPLRVLRAGNIDVFGNGWRLVATGPYEGYIDATFLSEKKDSCLQDKYPKFFEALNLDISDMYYWGRLQDQLKRGESEIPIKKR